MAFNDNNVKCYVAETDIGNGLRVKKSGNKVAIAGAADVAIGATIAPYKAGEVAAVRLFNSCGTAYLVGGLAIAANAAVYRAAAGKISTVATGNIIGYTEEACAADGDLVEVLLVGAIT